MLLSGRAACRARGVCRRALQPAAARRSRRGGGVAGSRGNGGAAPAWRRARPSFGGISDQAVSTENLQKPSAQRSRHAGGSKQLQHSARQRRGKPRRRRARASSCFCPLFCQLAARYGPDAAIFVRKSLRGRRAETFRQWIASTMISCSVAYDFYAG